MIIFIIAFTICFLFTIYDQTENKSLYDSHPAHVFYPNTSLYVPLSKVNNPSYKLVLLWTNLFHDFYWHQPLFFNSSIVISCSSTHQCQFTRDRNQLSHASVVAFHLYDVSRYELPERQSPNNDEQNWIFITGESPVNFYYQNPSFMPYIFEDYFDRSISYKQESPYSIFAPIIKPRGLSPLNIQHERELNRNSLKSKKKPIAWLVSNCHTFSQRESYVKELKKYIPVDIYGKCGITCSNGNNHQCDIDLNEYYFYLAFENSRCHSYITEKFWNIISDDKHRLVPVVLGANERDYEQIAPMHSFIHVNQYRTPEELAKYLHYLIKNPEKYLQYLQWREHTEIELISPGRWSNFLCPFCSMAYETRLNVHNRLNFSSWFNPKTECHHDDVKILTKCKQATLGGWMNWIHNLKCP